MGCGSDSREGRQARARVAYKPSAAAATAYILLPAPSHGFRRGPHSIAPAHRIRQAGIDEELFDVISGFEALSKGNNPQSVG